jgi:hypothetical protein
VVAHGGARADLLMNSQKLDVLAEEIADLRVLLLAAAEPLR